MATKDEIAKGFEVLIQETRRISRDLTEQQWECVVDMDGWHNKEVLAHIAGLGPIIVPLINGMANAAPGTDLIAGNDINAGNAGMVAAQAGKSVAQLAEAIATTYGAAAAFIADAPDETLSKRATVGGHKELPISDLLMRLVVLHGLGHVYSVYGSIFASGDGAEARVE